MAWHITDGATASNNVVVLDVAPPGLSYYGPPANGIEVLTATFQASAFTASNCTLSDQSGRVRVSDNGGTWTGVGWGYQAVTTVVGTPYLVTLTDTGATSDTDAYFAVSTTNDLSGILEQSATITSHPSGVVSYYFVAESTTTYLLLVSDHDTGSFTDFGTTAISGPSEASFPFYLTGFVPVFLTTVTAWAIDTSTVWFVDATGIVGSDTVYPGMWSFDEGPNDPPSTGYYMPDRLGTNGSVATTTEDSTYYPKENLLSVYPDAKWRSTTAASTQTITRTYDKEYSVNQFVLCGHNLQQDAIVTVHIDDIGLTEIVKFSLQIKDETRGWGVGPWGTDMWGGVKQVYPNQRIATFRLPDYFSCKRFRVDITDTTNPDGYIQTGYAYLDATFDPGCNPDYGFAVDVQANDTIQLDGDMNPIVDWENDFTILEFIYSARTELEISNFHELKKYAGRRKNVYVDVFPNSYEAMHLHAKGLCRLESWGQATIPSYNRWSVNFRVREILV
jgi:hypothetical protein